MSLSNFNQFLSLRESMGQAWGCEVKSRDKRTQNKGILNLAAWGEGSVCEVGREGSQEGVSFL